MSLTFEADSHRYFWDGEEVPGVSHCIDKVGLGRDYSKVDPFYRDRGIAVHMAINLYLDGELDEASLDPVIVPYFAGFLKYWEANKEPIVSKEQMGYSEDYGYAGTWDLETSDRIVDWKCSKSHDKVAELQGEAYKLIVGPPFKNFRVVQLPGDGTFKIFDYGRKVDIWPSCMRIFRWRTK